MYESLLDDTEDKDLLPIADDPFGNLICYKFTGENGRIVFWDHETDEIDDVADSFSELLSKLEIITDEDE